MIGSRKPLLDNCNIRVRPRRAAKLTSAYQPINKTLDKSKLLPETDKEDVPTEDFSFSSKREALRKKLRDCQSVSCRELSEPDDVNSDDVSMMSDYAHHITDYLQEREQFLLPITNNFISEKSQLSSRTRYITVDWMVVVWHKFDLSSDVLYLAVSIMDRFLQKASDDINKSNIQRLGITCLFLASKYEETCCPAISDFSFVTEGSSTPRTIRLLEVAVLEMLDFQITIPIPLFFLKRYLLLERSLDLVIFLSKYFLFLTMPEYDLCYLSGNIRAAAALCLANSLLVTKSSDLKEGWSSILSWHSGLTIDDILEPIKILAKTVVRQNSHSAFRAVKCVFSGSSYNSIARIPELSSDLIYKIAEVD